ncbi:bacteriophage T4 gp5 trimerisation domain-containing protein [Morganella morganii]|uniref:bacteriophage T4 gp5 trimerisation domain-containing protein n=1 Tax=Morganella morganii TaxID=582 RepID=UPI003CD0C68E
MGNDADDTVGNNADDTIGNDTDDTVGNDADNTVGNNADDTVGNNADDTVGNDTVNTKTNENGCDNTVFLMPQPLRGLYRPADIRRQHVTSSKNGRFSLPLRMCGTGIVQRFY